ncbi:hypothetical protein HX052_17820 [Myroides marinus]|uniref:hypothetical protein n=1 Tax=Myroides marinus TaxID=703342 RepID=UPI000741BB31|nr:hypothetical protein [Myroides marinus]KUF45253.1 hypothetical protein AS361_06325 [Myroides marinus]MDM1345737.1 hypothetical protein [Myroides marinus]MDM1391793.1 hypothetical protein [Myroides marinus]
MGLNYLDIVLKGFCKGHQDDITQHFYREFKKAEKEHYSLDEFFRGCNGIIQMLLNKIKEKENKRIHELLWIKGDCKSKEVVDLVCIKEIDEEIEGIRKGTEAYPISLDSFTNHSFYGHIYRDDIIRVTEPFCLAIKRIIKEYESNVQSVQNKYDSVLKEVTSNEIENKDLKETISEDFPYIFKNGGFEMFKYYKEHYVTGKRGMNADISFIYRKLYKDGYIHARNVPFLDWFNSKYDMNISKLKTLDEVQKEDRNRNYSMLLELFRQKN